MEKTPHLDATRREVGASKSPPPQKQKQIVHGNAQNKPKRASKRTNKDIVQLDGAASPAPNPGEFNTPNDIHAYSSLKNSQHLDPEQKVKSNMTLNAKVNKN